MDTVLVNFDSETTSFDCIDDVQEIQRLQHEHAAINDSGPIVSDVPLYRDLKSRHICTNVEISHVDVRHGTHVYDIRPSYRSTFEDGRVATAAANSHAPCCSSEYFDDHPNDRVLQTRFTLQPGEFIRDVQWTIDHSGQFVQGLLLTINTGYSVFFGTGRERLQSSAQQSPQNQQGGQDGGGFDGVQTASPFSSSPLPSINGSAPHGRSQCMKRSPRRPFVRVLAFVHQYQWASLIGEAPAFLHRVGFVATEMSNWSYLKDMICVRELERYGRACIQHDSGLVHCSDDDLQVLQSIFGRKRVKDTRMLHYVWQQLCDCPDDIFRHILSFLAPNPFYANDTGIHDGSSGGGNVNVNCGLR